MTGKVLPFARPGAGPSRDKPDAGQKANEIARRLFAKELRDAVLSPAGKKKVLRKLHSDEDAVLLAKRLGQNLVYVRRMGRGLLSKTLEQAQIQRTLRNRFALFPDENSKGKRTRTLLRYLRLSDAIAMELGHDRDLFLYEMLDGINTDNAELASDEEAATLGLLLDQMAKAIAENTELADFFDRAARTPGAMDAWGDIKPSTMTVLRDRAHEDGFDHWTEPQPIPSVSICRILEQTIRGRAKIAPWAKMASDTLPTITRALASTSECKEVDLELEIWREIGLAIGERYQRGSIGPMFSGRAHVKVRIDGHVVELAAPWTVEHFFPAYYFSSQPALLIDGGRWTACRADFEPGEDFCDTWVEPSPPPEEPNYAVEHYYFSLHPVNTWTLRRLLDGSIGDAAESLLPEVTSENRLDVYRFGGEVGRRFENALHSGELETLLSNDVARLKNELNRYLSERREKFASQDEVMLARWRATELPDAEGQEVDGR